MSRPYSAGLEKQDRHVYYDRRLLDSSRPQGLESNRMPTLEAGRRSVFFQIGRIKRGFRSEPWDEDPISAVLLG